MEIRGRCACICTWGVWSIRAHSTELTFAAAVFVFAWTSTLDVVGVGERVRVGVGVADVAIDVVAVVVGVIVRRVALLFSLVFDLIFANSFSLSLSFSFPLRVTWMLSSRPPRSPLPFVHVRVPPRYDPTGVRARILVSPHQLSPPSHLLDLRDEVNISFTSTRVPSQLQLKRARTSTHMGEGAGGYSSTRHRSARCSHRCRK